MTHCSRCGGIQQSHCRYPNNFQCAFLPIPEDDQNTTPVLDILNRAFPPSPKADQDETFHDPKHYKSLPIEPIYFIEANKLSYMEGNVIKYVSRWRQKDGVRDLKKAKRYLEMLINQAEGKDNFAA